jgi:hypothetical protein
MQGLNTIKLRPENQKVLINRRVIAILASNELFT